MDATTAPAITESDELYRREDIIQERLTAARNSFTVVGEQLAAIRDKKLYRVTHASFEEYCRERWSISRQHAYRLIDGTALVKALGPSAEDLSEDAVRTLAPVAKQHGTDKAAEALAEATEIAGGRPTAKDIRAVVQGDTNTTPPPAIAAVLMMEGPLPPPEDDPDSLAPRETIRKLEARIVELEAENADLKAKLAAANETIESLKALKEARELEGPAADTVWGDVQERAAYRAQSANVNAILAKVNTKSRKG